MLQQQHAAATAAQEAARRPADTAHSIHHNSSNSSSNSSSSSSNAARRPSSQARAAAAGAAAALQQQQQQQQQWTHTIPVHIHIISVMDNDGVSFGDVDDALVQRQISVLNAAYAAPAATEQAGVMLQFKVVNISRSTTSPDEDMCDQKSEKKLKAELRTGGADALNLYITDLNPCGVYGWSTWPWDIEKKGLANDGVVVHYDTLPGGQTLQYNRGATAVHEIGHFLGEAAAERTASHGFV
jgi:hypothetical protein